MAWSEQTKKHLRHWLGRNTWCSEHSLDVARFSVFVASVWNDEHEAWDEKEVRDMIREKTKELHPKHNHVAQEGVVDRYVSDGTKILDFLSYVREQNRFDLLSL